MPIDPGAIGATTKPHLVEWTDRETMLYALGVGAGLDDLAFTTENSHGIPQQVLPTYAVIACPAFGAIGKIGTFNFGMLLHGSQRIKLFKPLPAAGKLKIRIRGEQVIREMTLEGVISILEGMNPRMLEEKLLGFLVGEKETASAPEATPV